MGQNLVQVRFKKLKMALPTRSLAKLATLCIKNYETAGHYNGHLFTATEGCWIL